MPEWVQNYSERPIPEPASFTNQERRQRADWERRAHLTDYDPVYHRDPLTEEERAQLVEFKRRASVGAPVRYGGVEFVFAPGQTYQVPDGTADSIVARCPDKLRKLAWEDVRGFKVEPAKIHLETPAENIQLTMEVAGSGDEGVRDALPLIEMKDGLVRHGDGKWLPIQGKA